MGLITKEEKKAVMEHYDRMIAWAEKQELLLHPNRADMLIAIGERWTSSYCVLCNKYFNSVDNMPCRNCPLAHANQTCVHETSFWFKMATSNTWVKWLMYAKRLRSYVAELPEAK